MLLKPSAEKCIQMDRIVSQDREFWAILIKIFVYFAISKLTGAKISLSIGNFDQIWQNCCNFLNMLHCKMDRQFHVRVLFWLLLVFSQILNTINLNMLCPIHVKIFWQFLVFKKHQSWVWIVQSARIFISEHSDTYSHKIWNVICRLVQIWNRIVQKFYPKRTIYLSTVFWRPLYIWVYQIRMFQSNLFYLSPLAKHCNILQTGTKDSWRKMS